MLELESILERVGAGDPVGAAYRLSQEAGADAPGKLFYDAGSLALSRRDELGEDALRFARLAFAEAVERDPLLGEAHHDLATTMRELGMADDAILHYRKALELLPDDVDSLIGLGAAQCDAGKLDEAIVSLEHAALSHPDNGRAYANLGVALEAAGKDERAVSAYAKAVARFEAQLGEADDETAADIAARRRWARIQHAELLERLERWPQAIVEFRRLYEEEQALAEAEEAAAEAEAEEAEEAAASLADEGAPTSPLADAPAPPPDEGEGETLLEDDTFTEIQAPPSDDDEEHDAAGEDLDEDADEPDVDDDDEDAAGRIGLERLFARLIMSRKLELAFLVLDDLGGELADTRTRATYALYDPGDGLSTIMVEHWDGGERERLDPWSTEPTQTP